MKSWCEQTQCNGDHGEIQFTCKGSFTKMKGLKDHCESKRGPWHDGFMKYLELNEASEDNNDDVERNEVDDKAHPDDGDVSETEYCHVGKDHDSGNGDDNESAEDPAHSEWGEDDKEKGEEEDDHNDDNDNKKSNKKEKKEEDTEE